MTIIFLVLREMEGKGGFAALSLHLYTMKQIVMFREAKHLIKHKTQVSDNTVFKTWQVSKYNITQL